MPLLIAAVGVLGLAVGSFLNVVVHRVPAGLSVVRPASRCPHCDAAIRNRHNVPVLGWLVLRGRCRDCAAPISPRYPLVELGTGALFVLTAAALAHLGQLAALPAFLYLGAAGLALALIDAATHRLPRSLVLPCYPVLGALLTAASAATGDWTALARAAAGAGACVAAFWVLWFFAGLGFGDVTLAGVLGLALGYLGWPALVVGLFAGFATGAVVGTARALARGRSVRGRIAFGPFLVAGAWIALVAAEPVTNSYLALVRVA